MLNNFVWIFDMWIYGENSHEFYILHKDWGRNGLNYVNLNNNTKKFSRTYINHCMNLILFYVLMLCFLKAWCFFDQLAWKVSKNLCIKVKPILFFRASAFSSISHWNQGQVGNRFFQEYRIDSIYKSSCIERALE